VGYPRETADSTVTRVESSFDGSEGKSAAVGHVQRILTSLLGKLDICYGPVNTLPEAIADPNLLKRGAIVVGDDGRKHLAPVVRFKDEPSKPLYREPLLGEHTAEVLARRA